MFLLVPGCEGSVSFSLLLYALNLFLYTKCHVMSCHVMCHFPNF